MDKLEKDVLWTKEKIREEMIRLDRITNLKGSELPVTFNKAKRTLGSFNYISHNGTEEMYFKFSHQFYQDPEVPDYLKIDVIRHEYAHYMDLILFGNFSHGVTWKYCCGEVGAMPVRFADVQRIKRKERDRKKLLLHYDEYSPGSIIIHPKFGYGIIENISGEGVGRRVEVKFVDGSRKILSLQWVDNNCETTPSC